MSEQFIKHVSVTTCSGVLTRANTKWIPLQLVIDYRGDVMVELHVHPDRFELDGETVTDAEVIAALKAAATRLDAMDPRTA